MSHPPPLSDWSPHPPLSWPADDEEDTASPSLAAMREAHARRSAAAARQRIALSVSVICIVFLVARIGVTAYSAEAYTVAPGWAFFIDRAYETFAPLWLLLPLAAFLFTLRLPPMAATIRARVLAIVAFGLAVATVVVTVPIAPLF